MKERMPEANPEVAEVSSEELVAWTLENARNMARYSIGQTPPPNFASERVTDLEVARYLSGVQVDDKSLAQEIKEALDRNLTDPDGAFQAASLTVAKAIATEEVVLPNERGFFKRVSDKVAKEMGQLIASKSGKRGLAVVSGLSLVATACGQVAQGAEPSRPIDLETPTSVATEVRPTSTPFSPVPPTEIATPTPEVVRDEWQVSADGLILYNEATLAEGLFTINEAATQYTWDELIRSLYQINVAGENRTFLRQFPTLEAFREYAVSGRPVENMWIAVDYPRTGLRFVNEATWAPIEPVDLSTIAVEFTYDTYEDVVSGVHDERPFINRRSGNDILFEREEINGRTILRVTFHQRVMYDDSEWGILGFSPENYSPEHNLQSATQVVLEWFWKTDHMRDELGGQIRSGDVNPPVFNLDGVYPSRSEYASLAQDLANSPFVLH